MESTNTFLFLVFAAFLLVQTHESSAKLESTSFLDIVAADVNDQYKGVVGCRDNLSSEFCEGFRLGCVGRLNKVFMRKWCKFTCGCI